MRKLLWYLSFRSITRLLKNPSRIPFYLSLLTFKENVTLDFVSTLLNISTNEIKNFLPTKKSLSILKKAFKMSISPQSNQMPMSYEECLATYLVVRILRPHYVVETGVSAGRSTSFILCALNDNTEGRLLSIDPDPNAGYAIPLELRHRWEFINDKSENILRKLLEELGSIDVFLHDSLHTYEHMMYEYTTVWPYLRTQGVLLSDDIDFNSAFSDFYQKVKGMARVKIMDHANFGGILKLE